MSDTLVVAISQSGTTTDTNRTVDLVPRPAAPSVVAIVNRRNSDLVDKADGVLYTSDGRDVEMSVAVDQGVLRADRGRLPAGARARRDAAGAATGDAAAELLDGLRDLPDAMEQVLARREHDRRAPRSATRPSRRYWAVVGNGPNRVAADEIRIKLSRALLQVDRLRRHRGQEAHRPVVRAADPRVRGRARRVERRRRRQGGRDLPGPQGGADRDRQRRRGPLPRRSRRSRCPSVHPDARLRALGDGRPPVRLRGGARHRRPGAAAARGPGAVERRWPTRRPTADRCSTGWRPRSSRAARGSSTGCATAATTAHLEASTAVRLASLLRYATGVVPLESYEVEHGKVGHADAWSSKTSPTRSPTASTS